ncbi:MAG: DUF3347 domain-containing protein [Chitinophagaceae bacterium]
MKYALMGFAGLMILAACQQGGNNRSETAAQELPAKAVNVVTGPGLKASVAEMATAYFQLADALVNWDTALANKHAMTLATAADSLDFSGTTDSTLITTVLDLSGTIRAESMALAEEMDINEKRREFSMITDNLYPLLQAVQYNGQKLYYQVCPMAFNDNDSGFWISDKAEIVNPYLGTKHPKYASGMLHCGEVVDSIHFAK